MNKVMDILQIVTNGFIILGIFYPHAAVKRKSYEKIATNNLFIDFGILHLRRQKSKGDRYFYSKIFRS